MNTTALYDLTPNTVVINIHEWDADAKSIGQRPLASAELTRHAVDATIAMLQDWRDGLAPWDPASRSAKIVFDPKGAPLNEAPSIKTIGVEGLA